MERCTFSAKSFRMRTTSCGSVTCPNGDLTIGETFLFFGRAIGIKELKVKERVAYLTGLLDLPDKNLQLSSISGGQQRRVSLAIAILHEPELLILDEPTVGADSILRQSIWDHFISLVESKRVTILITTHYIEEVLQADVVGILRNGRLIAEKNPRRLLRDHRASSLEEVFLKLSATQNESRASCEHPDVKEPLKIKQSFRLRHSHMKALIWKHFAWFVKNWAMTFVITLLPVFTLFIYCVAIGHNPVDFVVSVANLETGSRNCNASALHCNSTELGCLFLKELSKQHLIVKLYSTEQEALDSVERGASYASITIKPNYSDAMRARVNDPRRMSASDASASTVDVVRDVTDKPVALYTQVMLYETLESFYYAFAESCGVSPRGARIPIKWDILYEWMGTNFTDFTIPGVLTMIVITTAILLSALAVNAERSEVGLERMFVIGINNLELTISHLFVVSVMLLPQIVLTMAVPIFAFGLTNKGPIALTFVFLYLTGFFGLCFGIFLASNMKSILEISLITSCLYFTMLCTSGMLWPIEAMHWLLRWTARVFPFVRLTQSLRNVMHRNWSLSKIEVYDGLLSVCIWSMMILFFTFCLFRYQKG
ncbi:ABC transporter G family member 23-like isoform X2 [Photinus pyralis]|uniref:ABC transporter G family member 23-like isoform X2 n=1 Tax=Photinus pyralis TaxID=7054 RepID=UPI001266E968|nr:ABC transporter G family member 23-like isoform X2 [Photinus pyralis]